MSAPDNSKKGEPLQQPIDLLMSCKTQAQPRSLCFAEHSVPPGVTAARSAPIPGQRESRPSKGKHSSRIKPNDWGSAQSLHQ